MTNADEWMNLTAGEATGLLYVPEPAPGGAVRLVVLFHGAGQAPRSVANILGRQAREQGFALLLPKSTGPTWDAIRGQPGPDLHALDELLAASTSRAAIDLDPISLAGFSDGASYALGVGTSFGDRFRKVIAFSPGFVAKLGDPAGTPRIFVSHGRNDTVLPIASTSRRLVPALRLAGYQVRYEEFTGGHAVPGSIADAAVGWLLPEPPAAPVTS
ncbi:MAG TPA: hypothetical protein VH089_10350 [Streptosporangiaceae bacterium]|nr:hypothetical protein [Streptosporangiaceae bacterium]